MLRRSNDSLEALRFVAFALSERRRTDPCSYVRCFCFTRPLSPQPSRPAPSVGIDLAAFYKKMAIERLRERDKHINEHNIHISTSSFCKYARVSKTANLHLVSLGWPHI